LILDWFNRKLDFKFEDGKLELIKPEPEEKIEVGDEVWIPVTVQKVFESTVTVGIGNWEHIPFSFSKKLIRKQPQG